MKRPVSATIDEDLLKWIKKRVSEDRNKYRNASHLIEVALEALKSCEKEKSK